MEENVFQVIVEAVTVILVQEIYINSLAPGKCDSNVKSMILYFIIHLLWNSSQANAHNVTKKFFQVMTVRMQAIMQNSCTDMLNATIKCWTSCKIRRPINHFKYYEIFLFMAIKNIHCSHQYYIRAGITLIFL